MPYKKTVLLILCLVFSACSTMQPVHVYIDSISAPHADLKKNYILMPGNEDSQVIDLYFVEYSRYIDSALQSQGFTKVNDLNKADILIYFAYGIGPPKEKSYSFSLPVYGQTGIAFSTTSGTIRTSPITSTYSGSSTYGSINTSPITSTYSSTTTNIPSYGIIGSQSYSGSHTTHLRYFNLSAFDYNEYVNSKKIVQIWRTFVTSEGSSHDLRYIFPFMAAAAKPYLGVNSGKEVKVILTDSDKRVVEMKTLNDPQSDKLPVVQEK